MEFNPDYLLSVDTETIGLDGPAFVVTAATIKRNKEFRLENDRVWYWEGKIDPHAKTVAWTPQQIDEMTRVMNGRVCGGHNYGLFDKPKLDAFLPPRLSAVYWDSLPASHIWDSEEPHGLKWLAYKYLDFPDDDETEIENLTHRARGLVQAARRFLQRPEDKKDKVPEVLLPWAQKVEWLAAIPLNEDVKGDMWLPTALGLGDCSRYAKQDAQRAIWLWAFYHQSLDKEKLWEHYKHRLAAHASIRAMKERGMQLIKPTCDRVAKECKVKATTCEKWAADRGYAIGSPKQVARVLFEELGLLVIKRGKTGPSTDKSVLLELTARTRGLGARHLQNIWTFRKNTKAYGYIEGPSGYVTLADGNYVLRPDYYPTATGTCRGASRRPNGQNVPKRNDSDPEKVDLRCLFGPRPGYFLLPCDYEQLELRIFLWYVGRTLDFDVHQMVGDKVAEFLGVDGGGPKNRRQAGKHGVVYPTIYGSGAATSGASVARQLNIPAAGREVEIGKIGQRALISVIPEVESFLASSTAEAKRTGSVRTAYGYPLVCPWRPKEKPYAAVDYKCQGTAGGLAERAMARTHDFLRKTGAGHLLFQIHDELLFEIKIGTDPSIIRTIKQLMERTGIDGLVCPVEVSICHEHWGAKQKWEYPTS